MGKVFIHTYDHIISVENLLLAWRNFKSDKSKKKDVQIFSRDLMENLLKLHNDLKNKIYRHSGYHAFKICDPKPRDIHKARVADRVLHHAIYQKMYFFFDTKFIHDSYSCRKWKGTHKAMDKFKSYFGKVSKSHTKTCWVLKCDIKKFFASIDHQILKNILAKHIQDKNTLWLLGNIINSFHTTYGGNSSVGLPLGNLTSQLLVNIYMNELDQYMKHKLKIKYYIRYADDFVILSENKKYLEKTLNEIEDFLEKNLKLNLHPDKCFIKTISSGVDFLGWVHFYEHRVLRTSTKKRMFRNISQNVKLNTVPSYLGMLSHGDGYKLSKNFEKLIITDTI